MPVIFLFHAQANFKETFGKFQTSQKLAGQTHVSTDRSDVIVGRNEVILLWYAFIFLQMGLESESMVL
ncbi:MAG: hypothetical protein OXH57_02340 [Ekhidna sp.]|nr:hypothetical protein [Ekhidna sp.]